MDPTESPTQTTTPSHTRTDWRSTRLITQLGTGHVIPNRRTSPRFVGPSHHDLDTGEEIEIFFGLTG